MNIMWDDGAPPPVAKITIAGWFRFGLRFILLFLLFFTGVICTLIVRLVERPMHGIDRPWSAYITQTVFRLSLVIIGIGYRVSGTPMVQPGALVSNHSSWLDIFALNAAHRVYFVSKAEVAKWPGLGFLASFVNTVYIERDPRQAQAQNQIFQERLMAGHKLVFFPEGTSTDGQRVIPFKSTLFQSFMAPELKDRLSIQPVSIVYHSPPGADPRLYGWWGDMTYAEHFLQILARKTQGAVELRFLDPVAVKDFAGRKELAAYLENAVRTGMPEDRQISG